MSDPVTNAEVEDVLSSIRRLVSEDKRPLQAPKAEPRNDRLVLTPALRVAEEDQPHAPEPQQEAAAAPQPNQKPLSQQVESQGSIAEEASLDAPPEARMQGDAAREPAEEPDAGIFDDPADDYSTDPYNFDDDADSDGEGDHFLAHSDDDDADFDDRADDTETSVETVAYIGEDFDEEEGDEPVTSEAGSSVPADVWPEQDEDTSSPAPEVNRSASLSAKIEALETAIGNIADTWEPDDPGESDYAGTEPEAMAWEDDTPEEPTKVEPQFKHAALFTARRDQAEKPVADEPAVGSEPATGSASETASSATTLDLAQDEQLIDEEMLRDLVSEIVRAELQGALGERITRNVRKLVRREIHRALTAQELE